MTNEKGPTERDLEAFKEAAREFVEAFLDEFEKQTGALTAAAEALTRVAVAVEDMLEFVETPKEPDPPVSPACRALFDTIAPLLADYSFEFGHGWSPIEGDPPEFSISRPLWEVLDPRIPQKMTTLYQDFLDKRHPRKFCVSVAITDQGAHYKATPKHGAA